MIRMNKWIITGFLLIGLMSCGWANTIVYDDFSSGDLSKWMFTPQVIQRTDPQVVSNELVWASSANAAYGIETLVSTSTSFDLSSVSTSIVQMTVTDIIPRTGTDTSFDIFGFGWQGENGDAVVFRYNWRGADTDTKAIFQMFYIPNGGSAGLVGGNTSYTNYPIASGDIVKLAYIKDTSRFEVYRDRAGVETLLLARVYAPSTNLLGNARIYFERNDEGRGASITMDDIATTPGAAIQETQTIYQDSFSTDGSMENRSVEIGFGTLWQTHADMVSSNGTALPAVTTAAKAAALPFVPQADMVYTLSADINAISGTWIALGFLSETNSSTITGNGFFFSYIDEEAPWLYTQPGGNVFTALGPSTGGAVTYPGIGSNGTFRIKLDTTGANWTATWYFNDTALRTNTYSGSLNITHVAFGGNPVSAAEVDNFKLEAVTTLSAYEQWVAGWGVAIGSQNDDYDNDGLDNLCEYGLGGDPTDAADHGIVPVYIIEQDGGTNWFTYTYPMLSDSGSGISYHLEVSDDLVSPSWTNAGYLVIGTGTIDADFNAVTNRISTETKPKQFVRLIIETM